ncbi:hypothetical protein [Nocardioides piscis]|uniref:Uncharacterized protein n=1 Tax=Nocardioides piscis TaxID=2714938 RepID=A0A6G7YE64_9ACTN|nr:hypothetical protein [Nocardioides piscis]QIK75112.1 hypothetical protein G7071_06380 [Nocardioides piscis]
MSESALFIGWGQTVRGREQRSLDVFNDAVTYYGERLQDGSIESFDPVILDPHGGDLQGFFLIKGSAQGLAAMMDSEEFQRLHVRATMIVDNLGIIRAHVDDEVLTQLGYFSDAAGEFS